MWRRVCPVPERSLRAVPRPRPHRCSRYSWRGSWRHSAARAWSTWPSPATRGRQVLPGRAGLARHTAQVLPPWPADGGDLRTPNGLATPAWRRSCGVARAWWLHTHSERLLMTHGAMEALQAGPARGDRTGRQRWASRPLLHQLYPLLANSACRPSSCPPSRRTAWMVDALEAMPGAHAVGRTGGDATVHNPLGCTMPTAAKQRLPIWSMHASLPLIEGCRCMPSCSSASHRPRAESPSIATAGWMVCAEAFPRHWRRITASAAGWRPAPPNAIALLNSGPPAASHNLLGDAVAAYLEAGS